MLSTFYYIILLLFICAFPFLILFKRLTIAKKMALILLDIILIIFMFWFGHSKLLLNFEIQNQIDKLSSVKDVNSYSDAIAVREIHSLHHPIQYKILSEIQEKLDGDNDDVIVMVIKANESQKTYSIRMINYMYPFSWLPFDDYQINQVVSLNPRRQ